MANLKREDLTGKRYGMLTILHRAPDWIQPSGQHKQRWHCICDCGNECDVRSNDLKSGNTTSCGCQSSKHKGIGFDGLIGKRFGKLIVISRDEDYISPSGQHKTRWVCKCDCGNTKTFQAAQLKKGVTSCGCIAIEHKLQKEKQKALQKEAKLAEKVRIEEEKQKVRNAQKALIQLEESYEKTNKQKKKVQQKELELLEKQTQINERLKKESLAVMFPEIAAEWNYEKNGDLKPDKVLFDIYKKVWWIDKLGHEWQASIGMRTKNHTGCPYCSVPPKKLLVGFNDLTSKFPEIAKEWHPTKNGNLKPTDVFSGSAKKIWWVCPMGHEYETSIAARTGSNKSRCPYCSNQKILSGYNDLATTKPELMPEWDFEKNDTSPTKIGRGSHYKAWWKCPFGHSFQSTVYNRTSGKSGCPICGKENHTSFAEQACFYYVKKSFPDALTGNRSAIGMELDIYVPSLNVAIEYDGKTWHRHSKRDLKKNKLCLKNGIKLIRIREEGLELYDDCICIVRHNTRNVSSLNDSIKNLFKLLNAQVVNVDVERDEAAIYGQYIKNRKDNSVLALYPDVAKEWHSIKNGELKPDMVNYATDKRVWWLGKCGHEYQMSVADRTLQNCECPYCAGKRVLLGFNDLQTVHPELIDEWDFEKNVILPSELTSSSDKRIWWKCKKCGYSWQCKADTRTRHGTGCPKCADKYIASRKWKAVKCIETGVIYNSLKEAEEKTGINRACISFVCRGKQKTAGKLHWEWHKS